MAPLFAAGLRGDRRTAKYDGFKTWQSDATPPQVHACRNNYYYNYPASLQQWRERDNRSQAPEVRSALHDLEAEHAKANNISSRPLRMDFQGVEGEGLKPELFRVRSSMLAKTCLTRTLNNALHDCTANAGKPADMDGLHNESST